MKLATKIIGHENKTDGTFISFEDASHVHRLRVFMNTIANDKPVYFFLRIPQAGVMAYDMFSGNPISLNEKAAGSRREGKLTYREMQVRMTEDGYEFSISNYTGVQDGSQIVRKPGDPGDTNVIHIPKDESREVGMGLLVALSQMS